MNPRSRGRAALAGAFTLAELLMVVAVLAILGGLVVRNGLAGLEDERSRSAALGTAAWLEEVRHQAMVSSSRCVIEVLPVSASLRPAADNRCGAFAPHSLAQAGSTDRIRLCAALLAPHEPSPPCPGADGPLTILFTPRGTSTMNVQLVLQLPGSSPDHCVQLIRPLGVLRIGRVQAGVCDWSQPV